MTVFQDDMDKNLPQPFADEMRGIATASGLGLGQYHLSVIIGNMQKKNLLTDWFSYLPCIMKKKKSLNKEVHEFHRYQTNEELPLTSKRCTQKDRNICRLKS